MTPIFTVVITVNTLTLQGWLLRAVIVLGPCAAVFAGLGVDGPPVWLVVALLGLGVASARWPDSGLPALAILAPVLWWAARDGVALHAGALLAAAALLGTHLAATLVAQGPASATLSGGLIRLWALRGAWCLVAAVPVWLLARAATEHDVSDSVWLGGLVLCLAVALAASLATDSQEGR